MVPERSLRVLRYLADRMRSGFNGRVELDLKSGGIAGIREIRSIRPADLPEPDNDG